MHAIYFHTMTDLNEYLKGYFSPSLPYNLEERRYSSLVLALRDARLVTNRNVDSGIVTFEWEAPLAPSKWPGVIAYLISLDLIGSCFKLTSRAPSSENSIFSALQNFSTLSVTESRAIEALRHSFAHNYGLLNIFKRANKIVTYKTHHFLLTANQDGPLIKERQEDWNGNLSDRSDLNTTEISAWLLGDFVETVFKRLVKRMRTGILI